MTKHILLPHPCYQRLFEPSKRGVTRVMYRMNAWPLFNLGQIIGMLSARANPGVTLSELGPTVFMAKTEIEAVFGLGNVSFPLSAKAARDLKEKLDNLLSGERWKEGPQSAITDDELGALKGDIDHLQSILRAEAPETPIYQVPQRRAWNVRTLIDHAEFSLSDRARKCLTLEEVKDIREAGQCLAFDVSTAAAFHMYRVLESVVLKYMPILGIQVQNQDRNLGSYIRFLENAQVDQRITVLLRHIKDEYRNPAIHPGLFISFDDASNQFALIQSAIRMMIDDLLSRLGDDFVWPRPKGFWGLLLDL